MPLEYAASTTSRAEVWIDASGVAHCKAGREARIVSLVPSLTELLCDLGLGRQIVGRTRFCIHPRETVGRIPQVGGTKDVDIAKVRELAPTHVIVNIDENRRAIVDALAAFVDDIVVTHPVAPADNLILIGAMGLLFSREQRAAALAAQFHKALERLQSLADRPPSKVLYLIWRNPWMTISPATYISRMLDLINWRSLPAAAPQRYPAIDLADYAGVVDRVLLSSEPYPFRDGHIAEIAQVFGGETEITLVDGEMLSWYGSRAIAGLDYLAACRAGEGIA